MKHIATIPLSPQRFGTPEQLVVSYDPHDDVAGGPVLWLRWQHMAHGDWVTSVSREVMTPDIRSIRDALDSAAWAAELASLPTFEEAEARLKAAAPKLEKLVKDFSAAFDGYEEPLGPLCGDPSRLDEDLAWEDSPTDTSADGEPSAFWEATDSTGPLTTGALTAALTAGEAPSAGTPSVRWVHGAGWVLDDKDPGR